MNKHITGTAVLIVSALCLTGCHQESKNKKWEEREKAQVGKIYNHKVQGESIENHENQFFESRLKEVEDVNTMPETTKANDTTAVETGKM